MSASSILLQPSSRKMSAGWNSPNVPDPSGYSRTWISVEGKNSRTAPAYRILPLNVAHSASEMSQDSQKSFRLRLSRFLKLDCTDIMIHQHNFGIFPTKQSVRKLSDVLLLCTCSQCDAEGIRV
jgi:hypothetical protein